MALTDDQRAMLRLLAQRGEEGYEDIAALMGITVDEVRQRVKEALVEVAEPEAAPEAPESAPTPPPPPAAQPPQPVAEEAPEPTPDKQPAPAPPTAAAKAPAPSAATGKQRPRLPSAKLPKDRGALIGLGAGILVLIVFAIVLIVGGSGGSSSSTDTSASAGSGQGGTTPAASENANLTQAVLSPVDGSDASGTALFGRFKKNVLLQVTAEGLEPSQSGQSYAIWLSHSGKAMVPVGTAKVPDSGNLAARFQIPAAVLVLVARSAFNEIDITRTTDATLSAAIAKARQSKSESAYTGTDVLRGKITGPFVGAASNAKGE